MPDKFPEPAAENGYLVEHAQVLSQSLRKHTGCGLMEEESDPYIMARRLYFAPFVLLSHNADSDPIFTYANRAAQQLFEMNWDEFVQLPSRLSVEPLLQQERELLLRRVAERGYVDDYSGIRVAKSGSRFRITHATVWNLLDPFDRYCGQAAMFSLWEPISAASS